MKLAVSLPTFSDLPRAGHAKWIVDFAAKANDLGFSSIWTSDHLLRMEGSPAYAGISWLDPMQCLAMVAPHTTVPLGSLYCGCLRQPVLSVKEIATLMHLTNDRLILAPVLGWDAREHNAAGFPRGERGVRTDEWLEIMDLLLTTEHASYEGRFYSFENVTIDPVPGHMPQIWMTGGAAYYETDAVQDKPSLKPRVIDRILKSDGWCVSAQSSPTKGAADWERLSIAARERGVDPSSLYISHPNFLHLVETTDREEAYAVQRPLWNPRRTLDESFEYMSATSYMTGTIDDVIDKLAQRASAYGLQEFIALAHPGQADEQLDLWAKHLLPVIGEL
jgi:alkanesulfonate monooxygenase SsuD/methylene tetrahydromethanopterin reductase-like flavin-dependent oxidoreductase (luciferase family)